MDIYRITRVDKSRKQVRYGTGVRAAAIARQVKQDNRSRAEGAAWLHARGVPHGPHAQPVELTIERAPVGEFTDVTAEFTKED
jgi:hypothetical protein